MFGLGYRGFLGNRRAGNGGADGHDGGDVYGP